MNLVIKPGEAAKIKTLAAIINPLDGNALGYSHECKGEVRAARLEPEHDWSSHAADAFGMMCIAYKEPERAREAERTEHGEGGWMN